MEQLAANNEKLTQKKVASVYGLSLATIKKYRKVYHEYLNMLYPESDILEIDESNTKMPDVVVGNTWENEILISSSPNLNSENDYFELLDINVADFEEGITTHHMVSEENISTLNYNADKLKILYQRIFSSFLKNIDESNNQKIFEQFTDSFLHLPAEDAKLLITSPENISDGDAFWKQFTLESKMWNLCAEKLPKEHF